MTADARNYITYTAPNGVTKKLFFPVMKEEAEKVAQFFFWVTSHGGAFDYDFEGDDEDNQLSIRATHIVVQTGEKKVGYFHLANECEMKMYMTTPADDEELKECHITAAEAFSMEMASLFDEPDYYANAEMETWGVSREAYTFTIAWEKDGITNSSLHEWHELTFPDGSTMFVLPGDGAYLGLPTHLEPQREAALEAKALKLKESKDKGDPSLLLRLADFQPAGRRN